MSNKTIITDQDKGSLASIIELLPSAHLFLCAFHRRQNIVKKFGGGSVDVSATCSSVYNILMKCNSVASLEFMRTQYEPNMPETYLEDIMKRLAGLVTDVYVTII